MVQSRRRQARQNGLWRTLPGFSERRFLRPHLPDYKPFHYRYMALQQLLQISRRSSGKTAARASFSPLYGAEFSPIGATLKTASRNSRCRCIRGDTRPHRIGNASRTAAPRTWCTGLDMSTLSGPRIPSSRSRRASRSARRDDSEPHHWVDYAGGLVEIGNRRTTSASMHRILAPSGFSALSPASRPAACRNIFASSKTVATSVQNSGPPTAGTRSSPSAGRRLYLEAEAIRRLGNFHVVPR